MPPKRPPPPSSPPPASSSSEDEESSSESEDEQPQQQTQQTPQQTKTRQQTESSDEEESESESESDDEPPSATTATKPNPPTKQKPSPGSSSSTENEEDESSSDDDDVVSPKPISQSIKPRPAPENSEKSEEEDSDSEDEDDDPPPPPKQPAKNNDHSKPQTLAEKSSEDEESEDEDPPPQKQTAKTADNIQNNRAVKRKREDDAVAVDGPKKLFSRVWSLEDELAILHGLIRYRDGGGSVADSGGFYNFVRGSLKREASKGQVNDKVRKLKHKFQGNFGRIKNGVNPSFGNDHEKMAFELSKNLWAAKMKVKLEYDVENQSKKELLSKSSGAGDVQFPYLASAVDKLALEYSCGVALKKSLGMLDHGKAMALEEKMKVIRLKEAKQHMRRIQLVKESVKLITDALSRSD